MDGDKSHGKDDPIGRAFIPLSLLLAADIAPAVL